MITAASPRLAEAALSPSALDDMPNESPMPVPSDRAAAASTLDHLALLRVRGADARTFLDSQLTRNVPADPSVASPFGYCSPKGRLLASGVLWADGDAVSLLVSRDIADGLAKRLRMYVLRAKATIDDATASTRLVGVIDAGGLPAVSADAAAWTVTTVGDSVWIRYPDARSRKRCLVVAPADAAGDDIAGTVVDAAAWRWLDIRAGLPRIAAATQERFVPQMLNLEALGGVDFRKGCFPGQEIVARSQYLGKLKRRTALATAGSIAPPAAGTDVWSAGGSEASGLVVGAERGPDGIVSLLIELPLALFASSDLRIGAADGPPLAIEPLPYALPDNEVFVRPKL